MMMMKRGFQDKRAVVAWSFDRQQGAMPATQTSAVSKSTLRLVMLSVLTLCMAYPVEGMAVARHHKVVTARTASGTVKKNTETDPKESGAGGSSVFVGELPEVAVPKGAAFQYAFGDRFRNNDAADRPSYTARLEDGRPLPRWLVLNAETATLAGIPLDGDVGVYRVKVIATYPKGESRYRTFRLEVINSVLTLQAFLGKVMENNNEIEIGKLEWQATDKLAGAAWGIYEPVLTASVKRESNHLLNTIKDRYNQGYAPEYSDLNNLWNASIEGLTPFGATYRFGYDTKQLQNSLQSNDVRGLEYSSFFGVTLTQPLLKGAGFAVTNTNIRVARANADIAYQGYRQTAVESVARAIQLYWQCYGAQEKLRMRSRSMEIAADMLKLNQKRYDAGKIDYTAVMDAESGLRLRQALVAAAEQTELTAKRNLMSLYGEYSSAVNLVSLRATDAPECQQVDTDSEKRLIQGYKKFPKYLSAIRAVEREKMRLAYAKNQLLPQLDIKGSYGLNGLDNSYENTFDRAWEKNYISWSVGLELKLPLFGDIKSRYEASAARLRKEESLHRLDMEKVELANQMEIVAGLVSRVYSQVQNYERVVFLNAELLRAEEMRFRIGKSDIRMLLGREEDHLKVRESLLDSRLAYQYALVNLYALEGSLLEHYGLSIADNKHGRR